jgi:flavodoxin
MKSIVLYCSITGSTKKLAEAISDELDCAIYNLKTNLLNAVDINEVEHIFLGSGVYGGLFHKKMLELASNQAFVEAIKGQIKSVGIFSTYAGTPDASESASRKFEELLPLEAAERIERYFCKGGLFGLFGRNRPVFEDIESCKQWARELAK